MRPGVNFRKNLLLDSKAVSDFIAEKSDYMISYNQPEIIVDPVHELVLQERVQECVLKS